MSSHLILDTGPWVALLCRDDAHHAWAKAQLSVITQFDGLLVTLRDG